MESNTFWFKLIEIYLKTEKSKKILIYSLLIPVNANQFEKR